MYYETLKPKVKKAVDTQEHFLNLFNTLLGMFEWSGLPDTLLPEWIETNMIFTGSCGVCEWHGDLYTGPGGYCGEIFNGLPTEYLITVVGIPDELKGKVGEKFAVGWNNATASPDFSLFKYANTLAEVDVSERLNVLFARLLRIPKVRNQREKDAIEESVKALYNGNFLAVTSEDNLKKYIDGQADELEFLDIADPEKINLLQYLNQYRDNIVKRFFQLYGQGMQNTAKLAQQTTDELHGSDGVSMILPLQRLAYRKKFAEEINKLFGTNITVDFSEAWQESRQEMHEDEAGTVQDNEPDKQEQGGGDDGEAV